MIGFNVIFLLLTQTISTSHTALQTSVKVKIIRQYHFDPPIETHLIETVTSVRSLSRCAAICDRHIICRTADYHSMGKRCRLFETLPSAGTLTSDTPRTVLALDYCPNGGAQEPEYVCTRSGPYKVQDIFHRLNRTTPKTLSSQSRGLYANMHGVYVSNLNGSLSFYTYDGSMISLLNASSEMTNIDAATRNGLITVHYPLNQSTIFSNNGTPWNPALVQDMQFRTLLQPYSCFMTSQNIYITFGNSSILFAIYSRLGGSVLSTVASYNQVFRPVISQWKDKIIVMDQDVVTEYNLNGTYISNFTYFATGNPSQRNYFHHDYAGRGYVCNSGGSNPGVHAFLPNRTRLAMTPQGCSRAVQLYFTKEQVVFVVNDPAVMRIIDI